MHGSRSGTMLLRGISILAAGCVVGILLCYLLVPSVARAEPPASIDPRAGRLIAEIEKRKVYPLDHVKWRPENGPWADYLAGDPEDALSAKERGLYRAASKRGDCVTVRALQAVGFLLRHPYLQAAHAHIAIGEVFMRTVIKKTPASSYCLARQQLNQARREISAHQLNVEMPFRADMPSSLASQGRSSSSHEDTKENRVRNSLCAITSHLAVADDYSPAIEDLLASNGSQRLAVLPAELEYYLRLRAKQLKLSLPDQKLRLDTLHHKVEARRRLNIAHYAAERRGAAPVSGLWRCPWPRLGAKTRKPG